MRNEGFGCGLLGRDRDLGRALHFVGNDLHAKSRHSLRSETPPGMAEGSSRIVSQTLRCRKPCGPMKSSAPTQVRGACRLRSRLSCQPFSFRNCSINATSLSTPSGGMAL